MYATFKEVLLENVVMKEQIANLNSKVQGVEATVSQLNSMVSQFSFALNNLTSFMIAHSNQSRHIMEHHDKQFVAQMEYTHLVFV
ncbi:hypothetical protein E6C27_scaffold219G00270 [Cucumis melo var. makuwa]|uniref:Uncharacterized protein n=1 Tax=Cucumis melo var. makuwa TaxID=1194695 RepID=A0A5A7SSN6_CUCMM|nr:hypothetical protein E6C27_scaffold219G00270 [Cucumis melo var. makuwa]